MSRSSTSALTLYVIHHSHTDVGYTQRQGRVARWHADFIRQVLAAVAAGKETGRPPGNNFKWVCETFWGVEKFLSLASSEEVEAFGQAIRDGDIGLSCSFLNFSELIDEETLAGVTKRAVQGARALGSPATCAMTADINGYSWGYARILHDCGVRNLFTCIHTHHSRYPLERPQVGFWWETDQGQRLLVWSGEHYHYGNELGVVPAAASSYLIKDECDAETIYHDHWRVAQVRIPRYFARLAEIGYPYDFAPVMASGLRSDNAPPQAGISDFCRRWNREHSDSIRVEMVTLDDFFDLLRRREPELPVYKGDWPDWWTDGTVSLPAATKLFRQAQRQHSYYRQLVRRYPHAAAPDLANQLSASREMEVQTNLALYAEHTFSHARSVLTPWDELTHAITQGKQSYAARADAEVNILMDSALAKLGCVDLAPGRPLHYRAINALEHPVQDVVHLAVGHYEFHEHKLSSEAQVKDIGSGEILPGQCVEGADMEFWVPLVVAAGEQRDLELSPVPAGHQSRQQSAPATRQPDTETEGSLVTENVCITWRIPDGITSWQDARTGADLLRGDRLLAPLTLIHEITPMADGAEACSVRGAMDWNRKGQHVQRSQAVLTGVSCPVSGPVFHGVDLNYDVAGMDHVVVTLRAYHGLDRVDAAVRLLKSSAWEPENVYLYLPFAPGSWPATLWLDKTGAMVRPRIDQIPGSLTDYYCVQAGLVWLADSFGVAVATPDTPLIQLGDLEPGPRLLQGDLALVHDPAHAYAWLMTNYWETNFAAQLAGFYEFRFTVFWGQELTDPYLALRRCRDRNHGIPCFRTDHAETSRESE